MNELELKLQEYESLLGKSDADSLARKDEIVKWLDEHKSEESQDKTEALINKRLKIADGFIASVRKQIADEDYKLLPLSYIAEHYFGKTRAWLYQRINGQPVRGRIYTLNEEQKTIFNNALQDIAKRIGSYRIA